MYVIRKKFKFEMAHQLVSAFSNCCSDTIHGHSYVLEVFLMSEKLNKDGMVIDFGEIKERLKNLVDEFDHALIMSEAMDTDYLKALITFNRKVIMMKYNSTAENMTKDLYERIKKLLINFTDIKVQKVRLHETDSGYAEYSE